MPYPPLTIGSELEYKIPMPTTKSPTGAGKAPEPPSPRKKIEPAVIQMFQVNMGLRPGEKVLILSDIPTRKDWQRKPSQEIQKELTITLLAKTVADIAEEAFPDCTVDFYPYLSIGRSGAEPTPAMAQDMKKYQVILAINSYSLTHTQAREAACAAGAKVATMRGAIAEMFYPDGSISVDYRGVEEETHFIAGFLTRAGTAKIVSRAGTNLSFSLEGRDGRADTGMYTAPGFWGNLPAGEAYTAPLEGTGQGELVIEAGWHAGLKENMAISFSGGEVRGIEGGGDIRRRLLEIFGLEGKRKRARCNLAELGIGTNPQARRVDITIEAEKIKGTLHIGIGDNSHMGGTVVADYHQDFVVSRPDLFLDGRQVMDQGLWIGK